MCTEDGNACMMYMHRKRYRIVTAIERNRDEGDRERESGERETETERERERQREQACVYNKTSKHRWLRQQGTSFKFLPIPCRCTSAAASNRFLTIPTTTTCIPL